MKHMILTGALAGGMLAGLTGAFMATLQPTDVLAGETVCLTKSRLMSWKPVDASTIEMTDKQFKRYTVHMQGTCENLTNQTATLVYRFWGNLSCLDSSVSMRVASPGRGALTCRVASVELAEDAKQAGNP